MHLFIFLLKIVLFARSDKGCELQYNQVPANGKRRYVMTSDFRQYIAEYTVANFWRYPIRRRVTYASALEYIFSSDLLRYISEL